MTKHPIQLRQERLRARAAARRYGVVRLLARRLHKTPDDVLDGIPADTVRRLGVPVTTIENDDGSLTFKDIVVVPGTMRVSGGGRGSSLLTPESVESLRNESDAVKRTRTTPEGANDG